MEILIVIFVIWIIGSIFGGSSTGGSGSSLPQAKPPALPKAPPKPAALHAKDSITPSINRVVLPQHAPRPPKAPRTWRDGVSKAPLRAVAISGFAGSELVNYLRANGVSKLYHFTDRANIPSIVQTGGLYSWSLCGLSTVGVRRPGGSDLSRQLDLRKGLQDYVRLSFTRDHPMMYAARADGRINDPVLLEVDLDVVRLPDVLFSDRNAVANDAKVGGGLEMLKHIQLGLIRRGRWNSQEEKGMLQAEILVRDVVPGYLINFESMPIRAKTLHEIING